MKTIKIFDAKNYPPDLPVFQRSAVRAIIVRENKILLVKSNKEGFYKFPGGGMEEGETFADTLIRETLEEAGYPIVPSSIKEYGLIEEKRLSTVDENQIFHQLSYYFTADVLDERCEQSLDNYEKELGFNPEWVDIETAIRINSEFDEKYGVSFVRRDTFVLKYIWENKNV